MLKKLDYSFSISVDEAIKKIENFNDKIDINEELEKHVNKIKSYFGDENMYDRWINYISQEVHNSIPEEEKDLCEFCNGSSKLEENKICTDYFLQADENYYSSIIFYVMMIENNRHLFDSKEILHSLTQTFFEHYKYNLGELSHDSKTFDNILLTHTLIDFRNSLKEMETNKAINEINNLLEELQTHKFIASLTDRVLSEFVKPQIRFFKILLKSYKNKKDKGFHNENNNSKNLNELTTPINTKYENILNHLNEYGFSSLEKLKGTDVYELTQHIFKEKLPYQIAYLNFLGFIKKLDDYTKTIEELFEKLAKIIYQNKRAVKGNVNVLRNKKSTDRKRYTAYLHVKKVEEHYKKLK